MISLASDPGTVPSRPGRGPSEAGPSALDAGPVKRGHQRPDAAQ